MGGATENCRSEPRGPIYIPADSLHNHKRKDTGIRVRGNEAADGCVHERSRRGVRCARGSRPGRLPSSSTSPGGMATRRRGAWVRTFCLSYARKPLRVSADNCWMLFLRVEGCSRWKTRRLVRGFGRSRGARLTSQMIVFRGLSSTRVDVYYSISLLVSC